MSAPSLARDTLVLLRCPRCGADYDPEQFRGDEVPRCVDWCEPFDDDLPAGTSSLEAIYRDDL